MHIYIPAVRAVSHDHTSSTRKAVNILHSPSPKKNMSSTKTTGTREKNFSTFIGAKKSVVVQILL